LLVIIFINLQNSFQTKLEVFLSFSNITKKNLNAERHQSQQNTK
jgi:hypothetical protein